MVVGSGMMAKAFVDQYATDGDVLVFASGVSNSKEKESRAYTREKDLLLSNIELFPNRLLLYFSTCSIYDPSQNNSLYVNHKVAMEEVVRSHSNRFLICRVSNVVGHSSNSVTIFNYLINQIKNQHPFELWARSVRNIIDVADVLKIVEYLLHNESFHNSVVNVANRVSYPVRQLVQEIETYFVKKAIYEEREKGSNFDIKMPLSESQLNKIGVHFNDDYILRLLKKYFHE